MANQIHEELEKWLTISNLFFHYACCFIVQMGSTYISKYPPISVALYLLQTQCQTLAARDVVAQGCWCVCVAIWYNCSYHEPIWACTCTLAFCLRFCLAALERLGKNTEEGFSVIQCHCDVVGCSFGSSVCLCGS